MLVPVFDTDNNYIGNNLFRTKREIVEQKLDKKIKLDLEYREADNNSWFLKQQEKDIKLQKMVNNGDMFFLGELTFEEFIALTSNNVPLELIVETWIFDEQKNPIRGKKKYYALNYRKSIPIS